MHPPPAIFNNVLDDQHFSVILNLIITICLSRLKHALLKLCEQNASYLVKRLKLEAKNINKILPESYSKSTIMAITVRQFSKLFRGSMHLDPPKVVFVT